MKPTLHDFLNLAEKKFHFELHLGNSTVVRYPHTTTWRVLPDLVVSEQRYVSLLEFKDRAPIKTKTGQTFAVAPGRAHNVTKVDRGSGRSRWAHIQCEVFPGVSLFHLIEPPLITTGKRAQKMGDLCESLGQLLGQERTLASLVKTHALGWELVATLLEKVPFNEDRVELIRYVSRLTPVLAYIEENLDEPLNHQLLAKIAGLSPSRFHFLFRSALGSAPYQYVLKMRLKKAQELLIRTDRSIGEIGQQVGHADPYHFSHTFRRNVGVSPVNYRKQMALRSF